MKTYLLLPLILAASIFSTTAVARSMRIEPGPIREITEGHNVIRALLQSPELAQTLHDEYVTEVTKVSAQALAPGYTKYVLEVSSCGNCLPKTGRVIIQEDMTPTYADGAIKYDIQITIEKGHF